MNTAVIDRKYLNNSDRIKQEEEELERLKEEATKSGKDNNQEKNDEEEEEVTGEEKTWKERYGNLRRHEQKQREDYEKTISDLKEKLETKAPVGEVELPKNKKELLEYKKNYPRVAKIIEDIAKEEAQKLFEAAEERISKYEEVTEELSYSQAMRKVKKSHPDFDDIVNDDDFHAWLREMPEWFNTTIYDQHEDTNSIVKVVDIYKKDVGLTKETLKEKEKEAATATGTKRTKPEPDADNLKGKIRESDLERMSEREYVERHDEIQKALREGNVIYDISGNAR